MRAESDVAMHYGAQQNARLEEAIPNTINACRSIERQELMMQISGYQTQAIGEHSQEVLGENTAEVNGPSSLGDQKYNTRNRDE